MTIITRFLPQDIGEARRSDYCFGSERRDDFFEARSGPEDSPTSSFSLRTSSGSTRRRGKQKTELSRLRQPRRSEIRSNSGRSSEYVALLI